MKTQNSFTTQEVILDIFHMNAEGHGVALFEGASLEVPFTLPGERVRAEVIWKTRHVKWAKPIEILKSHPQRITPACKHFGTCGGCTLQHMHPDFYSRFKRQQIETILREYRINFSQLEETITIGPHARRRIDFLGTKREAGVIIGFHEKQSKKRFNVECCPVVTPEIEKLFEPLHQLLNQILAVGQTVHIFITEGADGLDLLLEGVREIFAPENINTLKEFALAHAIQRLSFKVKTRTHVIYQKGNPHMLIAGHAVPISAFSFLQASSKSDQILSELVNAGIPQGARSVVDLFCGRGTLSLPLAAKGLYVHAVECDPHALAALRTIKQKGLTVEDRNLYDNPLGLEALNKFDAVVANPPRAGLGPQGITIAHSKTSTLIYVSCSLESFAKDAVMLQSYGFKLETLTPVDQFLWTTHMELVAYFRRD